MNRTEVAKQIANDPDLQIGLDEMIHDMMDNIASDLNNEGAESQLKWLEQNCGMDAEEVIDELSSQLDEEKETQRRDEKNGLYPEHDDVAN